MKDCGDRAKCDAFGIFKQAVVARAAVLLSNSSMKIDNKRKNPKRKKRDRYVCSKK